MHLEMPETLPEGTEHRVRDAHCLPTIAKGTVHLQLYRPTQFSVVIEEVAQTAIMFPPEIPWVLL